MIVCGIILTLSLVKRGVGNLAIPARQFHFVIIGEYETLQAASVSAGNIKLAGGAGFTIADNENFSIVVAVFTSSSEANSVAQRLRDNDGLPARVRVKEAIQIRLFSHEEDLAKRLANLFTYPLDLFAALTRHSIDMDAGLITQSHAVLLLEQMRSNLSSKILFEFGGFCDDLRIYSLRLTEFYLHFSTLINQAINLHFASCLTSNIRYITVAAITNYISMMQEFSK